MGADLASSLKLELTLPSNIKLLPLIGNLVETFIYNARDDLGNMDFDDLAFKIDLAVTEAIANAIKHGNKEETSLPVKIKIEILNNELHIEVSDQGKGFKMDKFHVNNNAVSVDSESGRGLYIIKKLMDEVSCSYEDGEYKVHMKKKISRNK
jgi:serine/threonine-protein kinase RsbW